MLNVSIVIVHDTRRILKSGAFPVKLRLTYNRKQKYFATPYDLTKEEFEKTQLPKPKGDFKTIKEDLDDIVTKARRIVKEMSVFTFDIFEKRFVEDAPKDDVFIAFSKYAESLEKEGRINTAESYRSSLSSLKAFSKAKNLLFVEVTPTFLNEYERWMLIKGKSSTTVGIYLRPLRALFNNAIASGALDKDSYPFGKRKYQIPAAQNIKKALSDVELKMLHNYTPTNENEERARDIWFFSYFCNGANIKDIALLKYKDLSSKSITFIRAKTARTTRQNTKPIVAPMMPEIERIIERWGNKPKGGEMYVFPILKEGLTPAKQSALIKQATKTINLYIGRIATALEIESKVTTYSARHSFSTSLKRRGAPIAFISESLGHSDIRTTESYLASFDDDVRRRYSALLTGFLNEDENTKS